MNFKVGEKVVALDTINDCRSQPIVKGEIYTVNAIRYCSGCGIQIINVMPNQHEISDYVRCVCGNRQPANNMHWSHYKRFAKIDNLEEVINNAISNEDYEFAGKLNEIKNEG
jgi:hypothetical protein